MSAVGVPKADPIEVAHEESNQSMVRKTCLYALKGFGRYPTVISRPRLVLTRQIHSHQPISSAMESFVPNAYPKARRSSHIDEYKSEKQGIVRVADPYNWLETSSEETTSWINAQEKYTRSFLDQNRFRQQLEDDFKANTNYAKVS